MQRQSSSRLVDSETAAASHQNAAASGALAAGCLLTVGSALLTCLMLFINGSLVMAILVAINQVIPPQFHYPAVFQFLLFSMPVLLAVLQWMMIDYVRTRLSLRRRRPDSSLADRGSLMQPAPESIAT